MTKILIPRSDSISAKIIEPSDFEKLYDDDIIPDYKKSGFTLSAGSGLAVNISSGICRLKGLYLESSAQETVSSLTASDVNYIYVKLARDSASEAESWDFFKNLTGVAPTDAFFIGTATTNGSAVTAVDQTTVIDIAIPKFEHMYFGDGSDGDVTISSNTSINEVKRYDNLTINASQTLTSTATSEATLIIQVRNTLTINGSISMNEKGAGGGTGGAGGIAGSGTAPRVAGGYGDLGTAGISGQKDTGGAELGTGATIYECDNCGGGIGGRAHWTWLSSHVMAGRRISTPNIRFGTPFYIANTMPQIFGSGGSGGSGGRGGLGSGGNIGGIGGAGGKGGGGIIIMAKNIVFNSSATISANGQQGYVGGIGPNGNCNQGGTNGGGSDGGGAGGGGEGGYIVMLYETLVNSGTMTVTGGASNIGGVGGNGNYSGDPGCNGADGGTGNSAASYSSGAGRIGTTKLVQL